MNPLRDDSIKSTGDQQEKNKNNNRIVVLELKVFSPWVCLFIFHLPPFFLCGTEFLLNLMWVCMKINLIPGGWMEKVKCWRIHSELHMSQHKKVKGLHLLSFLHRSSSTRSQREKWRMVYEASLHCVWWMNEKNFFKLFSLLILHVVVIRVLAVCAMHAWYKRKGNKILFTLWTFFLLLVSPKRDGEHCKKIKGFTSIDCKNYK